MADFFTGDLSQDPGWGWGPDENPARAGFGEGGGFVDSGSFDTSGGGGLFGVSSGDFSKAASVFKDLGGAFKSDPGSPQARQQQLQAAQTRGQAGGLGQLLQILAARANAYHQAARAGLVPQPTRNQGGLLGL